jgi:lipopolysaccharide transport system ATP-binding protein
LSKRYLLAHQKPNSDGLRHALQNLAGAPFRAAKNWFRPKEGTTPSNNHASMRPRGCTHEEFWALRDINLEINQGDVVGIIGRNGAGKSTLLKILSRITEPTRGRVLLKGTVASLLEVGTGFHPELTGRENIFLNGAILGMPFSEIRRKFDEIVAFAEIEQFLDTPVKRYSSGMYVRLAFAVAAHLESQIMFVDEVLAVGDAQFQKKCLGKIREVSSSEGRTVLFVSHNMGVVASLCSKGVLLRRGELVIKGPVREVLEYYNGEGSRDSVELKVDLGKPCITKVAIDQARLAQGDFVMEVTFCSPFPLNPPIVGVVVSTLMGVPVFATDPLMHPEDFDPQRLSCGIARVVVPDLPLHPGEYRASVFIAEQGAPYDYRRDVLSFDFIPRRPIAAKCSPIEMIGALIVQARWELEERDQATGAVPAIACADESCAR